MTYIPTAADLEEMSYIFANMPRNKPRMKELVSTCCEAKESGIPSICSDCKEHADFVDANDLENGIVTFTDGTPVYIGQDGMLEGDFANNAFSIPLSWNLTARI